MTDRELLELAAKAGGVELGYWCPNNGAFWCGEYWNPLTEDGDAFRLAVKLNVKLVIGGKGFKDFTTWVQAGMSACEEYFNDDPLAATRRAIVRAAAEIGRGMK